MLITHVFTDFLPLKTAYCDSLDWASTTAAFLATLKAESVLEFKKLNPNKLMLLTVERFAAMLPSKVLLEFKFPTTTLTPLLACCPTM